MFCQQDSGIQGNNELAAIVSSVENSNKESWWFDVTAELQWLEHLWDHENMFETGVVRANEC